MEQEVSVDNDAWVDWAVSKPVSGEGEPVPEYWDYPPNIYFGPRACVDFDGWEWRNGVFGVEGIGL